MVNDQSTVKTTTFSLLTQQLIYSGNGEKYKFGTMFPLSSKLMDSIIDFQQIKGGIFKGWFKVINYS